MNYTTPEIEIVLFDAADVIRTSIAGGVRETDTSKIKENLPSNLGG